MKVLLVNGSTKIHGCTYRALSEMAKIFNEQGIETEIIEMGASAIHDCMGCGYCQKNHKCVFNDDLVNAIIEKTKTCDGFVFGSPVFYAHPSGQILSLLDRLFYSASSVFYQKVGCAIVSARRAGTTASLDVLNKYLLDAAMIIPSSSYWNMVHGRKSEEVEEDKEGLQTMRNLALNMAWIMKCIDFCKQNGILPPKLEEKVWTNFVR